MRALLTAFTLIGVLAAGSALAQTPAGTRAVLAEAGRAPSRPVIIDGANWRCEGAVCTASGGANQPAPRACRRVAARLGPLTGFSWKGVDLTAEELAVCNA